MDYLEEIRNGEDELRRIEGAPQKHGPPNGMGEQAWIIDRGYLIYMLRLKARKIHYGLWARKENIGLNEADFYGMETILKHRKEEVRKDHSLQSYLRVISALELDPEDGATPLELEKALVYVIDKRPVLDREDYVYLSAYITGYAGAALNKRQGDYEAIALRGQMSVIESKYGEGWKPTGQTLAYRNLTNLASTAMNYAKKNQWRGLSMDLVPELGEERTVYDWIENLLKAYSSRLAKVYRKPSKAYVRARSAFFQEDYVNAAKQLILVADLGFEFFGQDIRRLRLMTFYELLYCQGSITRKLARKLEPNAKGTISSMRGYNQDLEKRQERQTVHIQHYKRFIDGFSALLSARERADRLPEGSKARFSFLLTEKKRILEQLKGYDHYSGKWLRSQVKALN